MIKIIVSVFISKVLLSSFEYRNSSPLNLFPYHVSAVEYNDPGSVTNPAYLPLLDLSYLSASANNPYSLKGLYSSSIRAGTGVSDFGFQLSWSRFGIDEYRENIVNADLGYRLFDFISIGIGCSYYRIDITTDEIQYKNSLSGTRGAFLLIPFKWIYLSYQQENIGSLINREKEDLLFPESSAGISIRAVDGLSLSWNINRTSTGYVNSFSAVANILPLVSLRGGYSRETSTYSAALSFLYKHVSVSYSFMYHSYLGATHSVGLTLSGSILKYKSINYLSRKEKRPDNIDIKRIDIKTCALADLNKIPVINEVIANRIIRYRETIGPLTEKSLFQIGMKSNEVKEFTKYIYGLEKEKKKKYKSKGSWKKRRFKRRNYQKRFSNKRKQVFDRLLEYGLGANTSLKISKLIASGNRNELIKFIQSNSDISKKDKNKLLKICLELM